MNAWQPAADAAPFMGLDWWRPPTRFDRKDRVRFAGIRARIARIFYRIAAHVADWIV